eukprot:2507536-Prymnesium_polylepis.2
MQDASLNAASIHSYDECEKLTQNSRDSSSNAVSESWSPASSTLRSRVQLLGAGPEGTNVPISARVADRIAAPIVARSLGAYFTTGGCRPKTEKIFSAPAGRWLPAITRRMVVTSLVKLFSRKRWMLASSVAREVPPSAELTIVSDTRTVAMPSSYSRSVRVAAFDPASTTRARPFSLSRPHANTVACAAGVRRRHVSLTEDNASQSDFCHSKSSQSAVTAITALPMLLPSSCSAAALALAS